MERWKRIRAGSGALSLCLLFALLFIPLGAAGRALAVPLALGGFVLFATAERRIGRMEADARLIRLINHHRHDWMNDVQVVLGLLRLNKVDKLHDYMDKIKAKALHESNMSRLGIPELIVYLLDLRAEHRAFALEVDIEEEVDLRRLALGSAKTYNLIRSVLERFAACSIPSDEEPNSLSLSFAREDGRLVLDFVYSGQIDAALAGRLRECLAPFAGRLDIAEEQFAEEKAVLTLLLPFRT